MVKTRENTDTQLTQYRRIHLSTCLHCYFATQWVFFPVSVSDWWPALDSGGTISISPTDELPWQGRTLTQSGSKVATMYHHVYGPTTIPWFKLIQVALETLAAQAPMLINATASWNRREKTRKVDTKSGYTELATWMMFVSWQDLIERWCFVSKFYFVSGGSKEQSSWSAARKNGSSHAMDNKVCIYTYLISYVCVWNCVVICRYVNAHGFKDSEW